MNPTRRRFLTYLPLVALGACTNDVLRRDGLRPVSRAEIMERQRLLALFGYEPGPQDGVAGGMTVTAIRRYQSDRGLPVTGEPSTALLAHLEGTDTNRRNTGSMQSGDWVNPTR